MAFKDLGTVVTLAQGATVEYFYFFANGADLGFQQAGADIKPPFTGAKVAVLDQRKQKLSNGSTTYFALFQNLGPGPVSFNLQGGGGA